MCTLTSTKPFEVFTKCKEHIAIKITDPPTRCPLFTFLITKRHSNFSFLTWSKKEGRHYGHIQNVSIWRSCVHLEQPSILISLLFLTLHRAEELGNKLKRKMLFLPYIPLLLPLLLPLWLLPLLLLPLPMILLPLLPLLPIPLLPILLPFLFLLLFLRACFLVALLFPAC